MVAARTDDWLSGTDAALRPPPRRSLSEWADEHYYLSPESAAEPGRWKTLPYQRGIMDAITDPSVERITLQKSARVGYTKIINATIGYYMHQDPCPILVVQPTVEDAEGYSKEEIAPMLRDCDVLAPLVTGPRLEPSAKNSAQTILHKKFPGGVLSMVGANSPRGFRRVSRRIVIFDEVDGYPPSAGAEGDQIKLGIKRSEAYWNRKIIAGSTPTIAGISKIEEMFLQGDQRRYYVPCPQCGHMDFLVFRRRGDEKGRGHWMQWPEGHPEAAYFVCSANGCIIEHHHKREMLERGEWRAEAEFHGHASFHIWSAYSVSPNATWGDIAREFVEAKGDPGKLQTFVNTWLGETWQDRGEAPDYERLFERRERYPIGTVPAGVIVVTAGVDVQADRLVYEVVGWAATKESWSIDAGVIMGDTSDEATWLKLDELLDRQLPGEDGRSWSITMMAVDSSYNTQQVYGWCRRKPMSRVIAVKGVSTERSLVGVASAVDVMLNGRRRSRGYKVWPVGVDIAKAELYGWLRLKAPDDGQPYPPGWCHFPEYPQEFFRQLTAEHLVRVTKRNGRTAYEWHVQVGRENHWLDTRVYARAAAAVLGIDRMLPPQARKPAAPRAPAREAVDSTPAVEPPAPRQPNRPRSNWLTGGRSRGGGWIGRRR